jgi:hypothetical protein
MMNMKEYDGVSEVKSTLQSAFAKLMTASKDMVSEAVAKLISRLNTESKVRDFLAYNCYELLQFVVTSVIITSIHFISWMLLSNFSLWFFYDSLFSISHVLRDLIFLMTKELFRIC